jgi:hypothetical protein
MPILCLVPDKSPTSSHWQSSGSPARYLPRPPSKTDGSVLSQRGACFAASLAATEPAWSRPRQLPPRSRRGHSCFRGRRSRTIVRAVPAVVIAGTCRLIKCPKIELGLLGGAEVQKNLYRRPCCCGIARALSEFSGATPWRCAATARAFEPVVHGRLCLLLLEVGLGAPCRCSELFRLLRCPER